MKDFPLSSTPYVSLMGMFAPYIYIYMYIHIHDMVYVHSDHGTPEIIPFSMPTSVKP